MSMPQASSAPIVPEIPESIPSQESLLSAGWIHALILMGHPLTSEPGKCIQKWTVVCTQQE